MSGRIIIVLSIVIIIMSGIGIFTLRNESQLKREPQLTSVDVIVTSSNVAKGSVLSEEKVSVQKKMVGVDYMKDSFILDRPVSYVVGQLATRDLVANTVLRYEDLYKRSVDEEVQPLDGGLLFTFPLGAREYDLIRGIKAGSMVDVYFRYEVRPNRDDGIVSKSDGVSSRESANLSKFMLMFKSKRVLKVKGDVDPESKDGTSISLEMRPDDIKSVYAIENLGRFYFFPSSDTSATNVSTTGILARDFIKELRGGDR